MNRPPVTWSRSVAALARTTGWRNVFDSTPWPSHVPGHAVGERGRAAVSDSQLGPPRSSVGSVMWSFSQADVEDVVLADPRPRRVERRPVDVLRRGLEADRDAGRGSPRSRSPASAGAPSAARSSPPPRDADADERRVLGHDAAGVARRPAASSALDAGERLVGRHVEVERLAVDVDDDLVALLDERRSVRRAPPPARCGRSSGRGCRRRSGRR